jgi:predicted short-subunit dehydrogenase-like oxidoreductase (DUF2520 family)
MELIRRIVIIGAGNVATHLAQALQGAGFEIVQIYSRTLGSAELLARKLDCDYTTEICRITRGADLYIFSVADGALEQLLKEFPFKNVFAVHTSGSLPIEMLDDAGFRSGVFYPLQTFSKIIKPQFGSIPICLEARNEIDLSKLHALASAISNDVRNIDSKQREAIHLAAVFACNFTNHLYSISHELLSSESISPDILFPLIDETIRKAKLHHPANVQTGPAVRKDFEIMKKHLSRLAALPAYQKIYTFISESIIENSKL